MITLRHTKLIWLALTLMITTLGNHTASASNEPNILFNSQLSLQRMVCYINNIQFSIDVPMPSEWSLDKIEQTSANICNSILETETIYIESSNQPEAVCDTDMNCLHYDKYKNEGVKRIFVAPDHLQNTNNTVLQIQCHNNETTWYTDRIPMLGSICSNTPLDTLNYLKNETKNNKGYTSDLVLSAEEVEYLIQTNWANIESKHNNAPTIRGFTSFLKQHPEFVISGYFTDRKKDKGLMITNIFSEFIPKRITTDLINFCEQADYFTVEESTVTCIWD